MHNSDLNPVRNEISNGIKKKIMRRVYAIWIFRKATSPLFIKNFISIALFAGAAYHVSFFHIFKNTFNSSESFLGIPQFVFNNFLLTDIIHQILILGIIIMVSIFFLDMIRIGIRRIRIKKNAIILQTL